MPTSRIRATPPGLALLLLVCAACQGPATKLRTNAPEPTLSAQLDWGAFPLGPNDIVRVGVYGHDALATPGTRVDMEGNLSLPLVGAVRVAGLSTSQAREAVTQAYSAFVIEPRVDLSVVTHGARRFYALGEFARAGAIEFDRPLTVMQAVALAGGVTGRGDGKHAVLLRGDPRSLEVEVINLSTLDRKAFLALQPDDVLFVRRNNAGKFSDELLPYLAGISSSLASVATVLLIEDRISEGN
jgi:protein involved in polysaccharide export with SLBB domain